MRVSRWVPLQSEPCPSLGCGWWPLIPPPTSHLFPPSIVLARLASKFLDSQSLNLRPFSVSPGNHSLFQKASHILNKKINLLRLLKIKQSHNSLNRSLRTAIKKIKLRSDHLKFGGLQPWKPIWMSENPFTVFSWFSLYFLKEKPYPHNLLFPLW